jgi:hypothetical protein
MAFSENEVQRSPCYTGAKDVRVDHLSRSTLSLTIYDRDGNPVDLISFLEDGVEYSGESSSSSTLEAIRVWFRGKTSASSSELLWNVEATITDYENGTVTVDVTQDDIARATGLFQASLIVAVRDEVRHVTPYYVEVTSNTLGSTTEPITVSEVRLELRDACPDANYLIDELEFTDAEIIHCIRKCIDAFNSASPNLGTWTTNNFPWRAPWLTGAVGYLLRVASRHYLRNSLNYQAGGVSVNDKDKWKEYDVLADKYIDEWMNWVRNKKVEINVSQGFAIIGSGYY